jgi:hypothetical protein
MIRTTRAAAGARRTDGDPESAECAADHAADGAKAIATSAEGREGQRVAFPAPIGLGAELCLRVVSRRPASLVGRCGSSDGAGFAAAPEKPFPPIRTLMVV